MLQSASSQLLHSASVERSVAGVAARTASADVCLPVNVYYGYWFSHWRA
ncbi:hypothetical protein PSCICN_21170 [Pseudomonas cichorii]|nr:hypothetical protein [Pseudomonas cichorii]GFM81425.1 hypothetical protein PSCICN_21170 [Pseudomonas cichorii]